MGSDSIKKRIPILTRENKDRWFDLIEHYFRSEDLWSVTQISYKPDQAKENAKAIFTIKMYIDDDDLERVKGMLTAKDVWDCLKKKYAEACFVCRKKGHALKDCDYFKFAQKLAKRGVDLNVIRQERDKKSRTKAYAAEEDNDEDNHLPDNES